MDFFFSLSLKFQHPYLGNRSLFSSLYTNDSKKLFFIGIFFCTASCLMRGEGKAIHFLTIT